MQGIIYVLENKQIPSNDPIKIQEVQSYYKSVKEQILNTIVNNFEVPLIIFVNDKTHHSLAHLEESDEEDGKAEMESAKGEIHNKTIVNQKWFEQNGH